MGLQENLDREIAIIENDDSLSQAEKSSQIEELYAEARQIIRE